MQPLPVFEPLYHLTSKSTCFIVGHRGVGKTTCLQKLARCIFADQVYWYTLRADLMIMNWPPPNMTNELRMCCQRPGTSDLVIVDEYYGFGGHPSQKYLRDVLVNGRFQNTGLLLAAQWTRAVGLEMRQNMDFVFQRVFAWNRDPNNPFLHEIRAIEPQLEATMGKQPDYTWLVLDRIQKKLYFYDPMQTPQGFALFPLFRLFS